MTQVPNLSGVSCLVVDENGNDRETMRRILARAGADVVEATSGPRGLAEATRARSAGRGFDLVFVAAEMSPMDGIEFAEHLRPHAKEFAGTILMIGPRHVARDVPRAAELGLAARISKPLLHTAIYGAIAAARDASPASARPSGTAPQHPERRRRILLAEDTGDVGWVIRAMIEGPRYEVDLATNGGIAVDLFRMEDYDLVLMDLMMPEFDGYWAAREISKWARANKKSVPIIAVTAYIDETPEKMYAAGFDDYLRKPFERAELLKMIESHLARGREARRVTRAS